MTPLVVDPCGYLNPHHSVGHCQPRRSFRHPQADAESSCTESRTDSMSQDGARNPWSAPTTELWAPTRQGSMIERQFARRRFG